MNLSDFNPTLMMHPALNAIINLSNTYLETLSKRQKINRVKLSSTCLYHTVLDSFFKESRILKMIKGKPQYPIKKYLGNIEIKYIPEHSVWEVKITNGGRTRKNAKISYKIKETLYIRKLQGIYIIDNEFRSLATNARGSK
jgi:hypothetical protein